MQHHGDDRVDGHNGGHDDERAVDDPVSVRVEVTRAAVATGPAPAPPDEDDWDGTAEARSWRARRVGRWLALVVAIALVVPAAAWLLEEFEFRSSGRGVEAALDDADLLGAVLLVRAGRCEGGVATGSGFVLDLGEGPVVVTNRHVVDAVRSAGVRPLSGGPSMTVTEVRVSDRADVAVLHLDDIAALPAPLQPGGHAAVGDPLRLVGFPAARPFTTLGTVAAATDRELLVSLPTEPGASGSPLVAADGTVVGQIFARTVDGQGLATPIARLLAAAREAVPAPGC